MDKHFTASKNYILRKVAGKNILVSVGDGIANFCGVITLNDSAALLWNTLKQGATKKELADALMESFEVTEEQAMTDVEKTLELLQEREMITYE